MSSGSPLEIDDFGRYVVHVKKSGQKLKKYRANCGVCGADCGFQPKSKYYRTCLPCKRKTVEYIEKHQESIKKVRSSEKSRAKTRKQMAKLRDKLYSDPHYLINLRIRQSMRSRMSHAVAGRTKWGSAVKDLGCSIDELKNHLESQFQPGMSWDNYGEWEIDHIEPLSKFNLTIRQDFERACYYSNLQPLWASDNRRKGANSG